MIDRAVTLAKLAEIDHRVRRVLAHRKAGAADYAADEPSTELVAFNLMLAVQAATDLALHTVADEAWEAPSTSGDAFDVLASHGVIPGALARTLRGAVAFRNAVAHGYAQLRHDLLHRAATSGLDDLRAFTQAYSAWLTAAEQ
jgi:uncharacterized protein YutE (UPF0331/DUF86 family)